MSEGRHWPAAPPGVLPRTLAWLTCLALLLSLVQVVVAPVAEAVAPPEMVTVVVHLHERASLADARQGTTPQRQRAVVRALRDTATRSQAPLRRLLNTRQRQGTVSEYTPLWGINAIIVTATPTVVAELGARTDVSSVTPDAIDIALSGTPTAPPEANLSQMNVPQVWGLGVSGEGVVVATLDSGVDASHPDLSPGYRGGANSWFDPYGQHPFAPYDASGHGTATMGLIVGGGSAGTTIGVAPGATWIAARIFDDAGNSSAGAIHQALQWVLDPDNNPATADAPRVVNNSWSFATPGCQLEFQADIQALRAADIVPVFAAGNFGSGSSTSTSPANYPESVSVGAIDAANRIWSGSSRGPTTCGQPPSTYPDVVTPAVNVWTTDRNDLYSYYSGTSMAAPAMSGAIALLLSAHPTNTAASVADSLVTTAADLGVAGPDDKFGHGRIDAWAAHNALGLPPATDTVGPGVSGLTATSTSLSAYLSDVSSGNHDVTAAEYFVDQSGEPGTGVALAIPAPSPSIAVNETFAPLPPGTHTVYLRGQDSLANWGPLASVSVTVDDQGPPVSGIILAPNPTNGAASVAIHATGSDATTGGSDVVAAEYTIDGGSAVPLTVAAPGVSAGLDGTIDVLTSAALSEGSHVVAVRARDSLGNLGPEASTTLVLDRTAPGINTTAVSPNPTNGATSVTLTASVADTATDVTSAEWFSGADPGVGNGAPVSVIAAPSVSVSALIDVSTWAAGSYTVNLRARDAAGNWTSPRGTTLVVSPPPPPPATVHFSTLGNTAVPTVSGTPDDADIYRWNGSGFVRVIDANGTGSLGLPTGANIDGFDRVDDTHFYVSFSATTTSVPGLGSVEDEDILFYNAGIWSTYFDGTAKGLTAAAQDVDAFNIVDGMVYFSTTGNTNPPDAGGTADDADIYRWNGVVFTRVWDASTKGLPGAANVDGYVRIDDTHFYLSFSATTTAVPGLGAVPDVNVVYNNGGTWSTYFDGAGRGLTPGGNLDIDAFDLP